MAEEAHPDFTLRFEQKDGYLYAFVTGPKDSLQIADEYWKRIHAKAVELESDRVLVEEDFPNQVSTAEMFQGAETIAEMFRGLAKVAHLDQRVSDMSLNRFGETVAANRGLLARVFNNRNDAEKWLKE